MPVYNGEKYLKEAIDSILIQTYKDFEFLIINDGSTDNSEKIILSYGDNRIRYIKNSKNLGFSQTANKGLNLAIGQYVARMDCDDLSNNRRLEKQIGFLEKNPDYGVVGTLFAIIDDKRNIYEVGGVKLQENEDLKVALFFGNIFCHGETMYRKSLLDQYNIRYEPQFTPCEDYMLWVRLSEVTKFKTLPEVLYFYMVHSGGMSGTQSEKMQDQVKKISLNLQSKKKLPFISLGNLLRSIRVGRSYNDTMISLPNRDTILYLQLSYQVFLFRLSKTYLKKRRLDGLLLLVSSFLINPLNWKRHVLNQFQT